MTLDRELQLREATSRFWTRSVDFPLNTYKDSRSKLQLGDIIYAADEKTDTQMGLLVVRGGGLLTEGWAARCKTLFYLSAGQQVTDTGGVIFHDTRTILEPRIDFKTATLKPMDTAGNVHMFHPTEAKILRPAHPGIKRAYDEYNLYHSAADKFFYISAGLLGVSGARELIMVSSGQIGARAILFDFGSISAGVLSFKASQYFENKANSAFSEYARSYGNILGRGKPGISETIYSAFTS